MTIIHKRHWPGDVDRPALALHCMMGTGAYWEPIANRLGGKVDLAGFDMPGHGRSGQWSRQADAPDFHTAVTRIAASFIERPLDLIGHSLGATIALRIAVAAPEALRSLTLIEPVLFAAATQAPGRDRNFKIGSLVAQKGPEAACREFLDVWGLQPFDDLPPTAQRQMINQIDLVAATESTLTNDDANILRTGGLESIVAPVMIIVGEKSPGVVHDIADVLAGRLADVGRAFVPSAGHMLPLTHPDKTASLISVNLERS